MLDICCVISGTYPVYLAGIFTSFCKVTYVAKTKSPFLESLFRRNKNFEIGPFEFWLNVENTSTPDCAFYDVTSGDITVPFEIMSIVSWIDCGSQACLNFTEFIWNNLGILFSNCTPLMPRLSTPPPKYCVYNIIKLVAMVGDRISSATSVSMISKLYSRRSSAMVAMAIPEYLMYVCESRRP